MSAQSQANDWSKTVSKGITDDERKEVIQFAKDRGIEIGDIDGFDGDIKLLEAEIYTIHKTCESYDIKSTVTVNSRILDDADFAEKVPNEPIITFNTKALRDRKITEHNIVNGGDFASRTIEDIALHEVGHIIMEENGVSGLEIGRKAYYNVFEKHVSSKMTLNYLGKAVSPYAGRETTEVISEVIVRNKNNPTEFTKAFVKLLKGAIDQ